MQPPRSGFQTETYFLYQLRPPKTLDFCWSHSGRKLCHFVSFKCLILSSCNCCIKCNDDAFIAFIGNNANTRNFIPFWQICWRTKAYKECTSINNCFFLMVKNSHLPAIVVGISSSPIRRNKNSCFDVVCLVSPSLTSIL